MSPPLFLCFRTRLIRKKSKENSLFRSVLVTFFQKTYIHSDIWRTHLMHVLAQELNEMLSNTIVDAMLSDVGRRMFFPKGIVAQSAEAGQKATRFNATVGMATSGGQPMYLNDIYNKFVDEAFKPSELFAYAPGGGDQQLRALWKEQMVQKNPSLNGKTFSL